MHFSSLKQKKIKDVYQKQRLELHSNCDLSPVSQRIQESLIDSSLTDMTVTTQRHQTAAVRLRYTCRGGVLGWRKWSKETSVYFTVDHEELEICLFKTNQNIRLVGMNIYVSNKMFGP